MFLQCVSLEVVEESVQLYISHPTEQLGGDRHGAALTEETVVGNRKHVSWLEI